MSTQSLWSLRGITPALVLSGFYVVTDPDGVKRAISDREYRERKAARRD